MNGLMIDSTGILAGVPTIWTIVGLGDVDGDGTDDIVWRNTATGDVAVWLGNGVNAPTTTGVIAGGVPLEWVIAGVGDLDGDGKADIVYRNTSTGDVSATLMNGLVVSGSGVITSSVPLEWVIAGVGDLDGDGQADLVWRETTTGDVGGWLMNGLSAPTTGVIASSVPLEWEIQP